MSTSADPRLDAYISAAPDFARPILRHLRGLVRRGCPGVRETMKWSHPSFVYDGKILCGMAAFKAHIRFGFWQPEAAAHVARKTGHASLEEGRFGRITRLGDLPDDATLLGLLADAARLQDALNAAPKPRPAAKPERKPDLPMPPEFSLRLNARPEAAATFEKLPPGQRREYLEWIIGAKREETREKRMATSIEWLAEGKRLHWRYEPARG